MIPSITRNAPPPLEILSRLGRTIEEYRRDVEYLALHRDELTARLPDRWIAVFDGEVAASSRKAEDLPKKLHRKGLARTQVVIDYLSSEHVKLILRRT